MPHRRYMSILKLDEAELKSRRSFFEVTDEDLARLASLRGFAEAHTDEVVEAFYELILGHPQTRKFFENNAELLRHEYGIAKTGPGKTAAGH